MAPVCIVFEDGFVDRLRPINWTRPTHAIHCGVYSLADLVAETGWETHCHVRPYLKQRVDPDGRMFNDKLKGPILFLNAALAPDLAVFAKVSKLVAAGESFLALDDQRVAAALAPADFSPEWLTGGRDLVEMILEQRLPVLEEEFPTFGHPFDIVKHHERLMPTHLRRFVERSKFRTVERDVFVGEETQISPNVVFDSSDGPIVIGNGVTVRPFSYFSGPAKVGDRSLIIDHAAIKHGTLLGKTVKAGGEIEISIVEDYSNKQHHGFLGHAFVGSWCNLGAGTSNSDLKNTYGDIGIEIDGRSVATGMQFAGCVVGDHTKTAINTSIFTGKLIGISSFVYGFVTTNVPSFTNYARSFGQVTEVGVDVAIKTQARMGNRRKVEMSPTDVKLMQDLFELTRAERQLSSEQVVL